MDTNDGFRKLVLRVVLFVLIGWAVALMRAVRRDRGWDDWTDTNREWKPAPLPVENDSDEQPAKRRPFRAHKLATSMGFVVVFFAAASFTAGAGDMVAKAFDPARCAALMQVTGEDESVCAELTQEAAPEAMPLPSRPPPPPRHPRQSQPSLSRPPSCPPGWPTSSPPPRQAQTSRRPLPQTRPPLPSSRRSQRTPPPQLPLRIRSRTCSLPSRPRPLGTRRTTRATGWSSVRRSRRSPHPSSKTRAERRPCG